MSRLNIQGYIVSKYNVGDYLKFLYNNTYYIGVVSGISTRKGYEDEHCYHYYQVVYNMKDVFEVNSKQNTINKTITEDKVIDIVDKPE